MLSPGGPGWVRAFAPAKLNPWLEVLGPRPDGYHELETVLIALDLGDRLAARRTTSGSVELRLDGPAASPDIPRDGRNLAVRGAQVALGLARERGLGGSAAGLELVLDKRIPSQSGLGGASSDAAAALLAGASALGLDLGPADSPNAAGAAARAALAQLGSDCAFFLEAHTGAGLCTARGERVRPLLAPQPPWRIALLVPAVACPTAAVYAALGAQQRPPRPLPDLGAGRLPPAAELAQSPPFNRLEAAALRAAPELGSWRELLEEIAPDAFHLSGSGSSFFAPHADAGQAGRTLERALAGAARRGLAVRGAWVASSAARAAHILSS